MTTPMDLKVRVLGDVSQFDGAMRQAAGSASGFKTALGGALSLGAMAAFVNSTTAAAEKISDTSKALGISAEAFQAVDLAARHAGSSFDELRVVFTTLEQKQGEVINGSKEAAAQFAAFGLTAEQVAGMNMEQLFDAVAQAIARGSDRATTMANAVDLIGRAAKTSMGALREIGDLGLEGAIGMAERQGNILATPQADAIAAGRDVADDVLTAFRNQFLQGLAAWGELFGIKVPERPAGPTPEEQAAAAAATRQKAVEADNTKLEAVRSALDKQLQKYSLSEEGRLGLRRADFERVTREGGTEEKRLQAEGKWAEARNVALRTAIEAMKLQGEIADLEGEVKRKADSRAQEESRFQQSLEDIRVAAPQAADQMARIGGYMGGQTDPAQNTRNRQLEVQKRIEEHTRRMAEKDGGVTA